MKKTFVSFALSVVLILNFSVTALAADYPEGFLRGTWVENGNTFLGNFDLSTFTELERKSFIDFVSSPYSLVFYQDYGNRLVVYFYNVDVGVSLAPLRNGNDPNTFVGDFVKNGVETHCRYYRFDVVSSDASFPKLLKPTSTFPANGRNLYFVSGDGQFTAVIGGNFFSTEKLEGLPQRYFKNDHVGDLYIRTYPANLFPEPTPEPTPGPTLPPFDPPKPPEVTQPPIGYPTFPKVENVYIPYDTSLWNEFANRIRSAIGSSTNIGFVVLGIILGIYVVLRIIRTFAGTRKE